MAITTRQTSLLVNQDWTKLYESFRNADFQAYDFQTLRKSMIDYLRIYYPESFNDFIESSEYIALIDLIAFLGQSLAFRSDLNARENFIDTAERRDSVLKLAKLISYIPKRNQTANGFLKFESVQSSEQLQDSNGIDLTNLIVKWNDSSNINWYEQFVTVLNSALPSNQQIGRPANTQLISGVTNSEYNVNLPPGTLPVFGYSTQVENATLNFEIVSGTSVGQNYIYESSPSPGKPLNIIYKNDNLGNSSNNTGFFFYFKQGTLQNQSFSFAESIPNNLVSINTDNINNTDTWLYEVNSLGGLGTQWEQIPSVTGVNIIYNNNAAKKSFQVSTRGSDQIDLVFGDGTFAAIPQGSFRTYFRVSAGLSYTITPDEMTNIRFVIPYISRSGRLENLTIIASLKYTVANALPRESLAEIKTKAPQLYYTQNRMVTGEDYNTFPYSNYSTISKLKAVNRTSSGISRYLDVFDVTGRYSSTNIFAEDGIVYKEDADSSFNFTFNTTSDINRIIQNQVLPAVRNKTLQHFYYEYFNRYSLSNLFWSRSVVGSGSSSGYFVDNQTNKIGIGPGVVGNNKYMAEGSIIIFSPGQNNYFNSANEIVPLPSSGQVPQNGQPLIYASITQLIGNGNQGNLVNGQGPVALSMNIPSNAQALVAIPGFSNSFSTSFISQLITLISNYSEFGIRYSQESQDWVIVNSEDLDIENAFSQQYQGASNGLNLDSSWVLAFTLSSSTYTVQLRGLSYIFESVSETKFYFDDRVKIFDPVTGFTVNDSINVLKVNGNPDTGFPLTENVLFYIYNQIAESDGYVDASKILVTYSDINNDGVPDDPDIFNSVVQPIVDTFENTNEIIPFINVYPLGQVFYTSDNNSYYRIVSSSNVRSLQLESSAQYNKFVFFIKTYGYSSFVSFEPVTVGTVNSEFPNEISIVGNINNYPEGQIFYTYADEKFYILNVVNGVRSLVESNDYLARIGRPTLYFQYRHNAPGSRRVDPSPSNLIDLYILTKEYETNYRAWALDTTGTISEPSKPTGESLNLSLSGLENYKSVSDAIIYNSAKFKPLFGNKARPELQATFKVIKNSNVNLTDSEIRSQVLALINSFFAVGNWDFGETFYFTELATYIQQSLAPNISSIIIVPNSTSQTYGSLQQISSDPNEILISCATVQNIEIITAITAAHLNVQNLAVNTIIN